MLADLRARVLRAQDLVPVLLPRRPLRPLLVEAVSGGEHRAGSAIGGVHPALPRGGGAERSRARVRDRAAAASEAGGVRRVRRSGRSASGCSASTAAGSLFVAASGGWPQVRAHWPIALAMLFGSYLAGSTPMGGGSVAFPILVLLLGEPAALGRSFAFAIQALGMSSAVLYLLAAGRPLAWGVLRWALLGSLLATPHRRHLARAPGVRARREARLRGGLGQLRRGHAAAALRARRADRDAGSGPRRRARGGAAGRRDRRRRASPRSRASAPTCCSTACSCCSSAPTRGSPSRRPSR